MEFQVENISLMDESKQGVNKQVVSVCDIKTNSVYPKQGTMKGHEAKQGDETSPGGQAQGFVIFKQ